MIKTSSFLQGKTHGPLCAPFAKTSKSEMIVALLGSVWIGFFSDRSSERHHDFLENLRGKPNQLTADEVNRNATSPRSVHNPFDTRIVSQLFRRKGVSRSSKREERINIRELKSNH